MQLHIVPHIWIIHSGKLWSNLISDATIKAFRTLRIIELHRKLDHSQQIVECWSVFTVLGF